METTYYDISSLKLPAGFDGYKIALVSDFHNAAVIQKNGDVISILDKEAPDIIVLTGDIADFYHTDIETAVLFSEQASKLAPCFFVTGNHEARLSDSEYMLLEESLLACGITVLHNGAVTINRGEDKILLLGVDDPSFAGSAVLNDLNAFVYSEAERNGMQNGFKILLAHRPEYFEVFKIAGIDLALCGHTHGGQIRLPFIGGIFAPDQGFFPQYDSGVFAEDSSFLVISRGIGNSSIPLRINNRPEVVIVRLKCE